MTKNRLLELVISFGIYSIVIFVCISIFVGIDFKSKLNIIEDRNNLIEQYLDE